MKKLHDAIERFSLLHPGFGIPRLMFYVVICNAVIYVLSLFSSYSAVSFLAFHWASIKSGEVWRLFTFFLMPGYSSASQAIWMLLFLYFYYMLGTTLEREWGTAKFTLYYFSGVFLTLLTGVILGIVQGDAWMAGAMYVNLSLFFAFAALYPDTTFYILFIIPVKAKYLAWIDAALFAVSVVTSLLAGNVLEAVLPVAAILNFFVFFWPEITGLISRNRARTRRQVSHQTIRFHEAARAQKRAEEERGYRHKCTVCGRTDADYPDLEFRYCSRCAGYHCYCQDHIFNHVHFTE